MDTKLVIFDLDGTLLDTLDDLCAAVNAALESEGFPPRTRDEVRRFVGNGIGKLIDRAVPEDCAKPVRDRVYTAFTAYYEEHCMDKTAPYPGVLSLLEKLRAQGVHTAVVSNKADFAVKKLCETLFGGLTEFAVGERADLRRKPAPDMVFAALERFGVSPADAVFVGDSEVDVLTAKNAGVRGISVLWGLRDRDVLSSHGAAVFAADAGTLYRLIAAVKRTQ